MIRKFTLINSKNMTWELNDLNSFAVNPSDLGIEFDNNYINYHTDFITSKVNLNMNIINFDIIFGATKQNAYEEFSNFTVFINFQPMILKYETDSGTNYRIVRIKQLTKTEIKNYYIIQETFSIECMTPWFNYKDYEDFKNSNNTDTGGKIYAQACYIPDENAAIVGTSVVGTGVIG